MILQAKGICKSFGFTKALQDVSISLQVGKVHALVGENGAGKSTLFKILSGYVPRDAGSIEFVNKIFDPVEALRSKANDIVLVHQELNVNTSIGISENIFLDRMREFANPFGIINYKAMQKQAQSVLDEIDAGINVQWNINALDLGQMKVLQVAQALAKRPKIVFLDESTAYLNISEIKSLLKVVDNLRARGIAIGFVSHHLDEIEMIADSMTILKDGNLVGSYQVGELTTKQIESLMVGRDQAFDFIKNGSSFKDAKTIFEMKLMKVPKLLESTSFFLKEGEILGLAGLKGAGGEAVLETIIGELEPTEGEMKLFSDPYAPKGVYDANSAGISYLPGNRQSEGIITDFSLRDNIVMSDIPRKSIFVDDQQGNEKTEHFMEYLSIRAGSIKDSCNSLSGGNMQKVVLAKCLYPGPKILLLNNPTRGIDVATRFDIYKKIYDLAKITGLAVILLSEDLIELIGLSDRILVFNKNKLTKELNSAEKPTEKAIISFMI